MSWKKNAISYLLWLVYMLMICGELVGLASILCTRKGLSAYWGTLAAALYAAFVSAVVFLIHRGVSQASFFVRKNRSLFLLLEAVLMVLLLAIGLVIRVQGMENAGQAALYYETAEVKTGYEMPRAVHGAVYVYLRMLHTVLALFGNHFAAGIWVQIVLQLSALIVLYFMVRNLAGTIPALVMFGLCMCSPYMVRSALLLSPEMLYFAFVAVALALVSAGCGGKLRPFLFLPAGILIALFFYLDVLGSMLLIWAAAVVFCDREEDPGRKRKVAAFLLCLAGCLVGFLGCVFADAVFSRVSMLEIFRAWLLLYQPESFRMPVTIAGGDTGLESIILIGMMVFGIFSFWCDVQRERMAVCLVGVLGIMFAEGYGILTAEIPGGLYLYLLFALLAGLGIGQCFSAVKEGAEEMGSEEENGGITAEVVCKGTKDGKGEEREASRDRSSGALNGESGGAFSEKPDGALNGEPGDASAGQAVGTAQEISETVPVERQEPTLQQKEPVKYIENPLPLPKKHVKRVLDYPLELASGKEDFDYPTAADDDFDI